MRIDQVYENLELARTLFSKILQNRNYKRILDSEISWSNYLPGISDLIYTREFEFIISKRQYSFLLIDDSILQMVYIFKGEKVKMIRLAYYPKPELKNINLDGVNDYFEDSINDFFKEQYYTMFDLISSDFTMSNSNHVRIDYNDQHDTHSKNHFQFGSINEIRIPIDNIVLPFTFLDFIAKNLFANFRNSIIDTQPYLYLKAKTDSLYYRVEETTNEDNLYMSRNMPK